MKKFRIVCVGFMLTFLSSWCGLVLLPIIGLSSGGRDIELKADEELPPEYTALELRGEGVYRANGCIYCHSQQVSPPRARTDIARNWGRRRTIANDYVSQSSAQMGTMRTGPDLANIGVRNSSDTWHLLHLYDPQITSEGSNMPPFRFLFKRQKIGKEGKSKNALVLLNEYAVESGMEVVPTDDAIALVAYLKTLKLSDYKVPGAEKATLESIQDQEKIDKAYE